LQKFLSVQFTPPLELGQNIFYIYDASDYAVGAILTK